MCYRFCLIACGLLVGALAVHSAAVDQTQLESKSELVVEKVADGQEPAVAIDVNAVPEQCHQPKETGRCFALFYRFAYSLDTQSCEEFVYGGCAGNSNNFETKEQCEETCLGRAAAATTAETATEPTSEESTEQPLSSQSPTA